MKLKSIIKLLIYWTLPLGIKNSLLSLYSKYLSSKNYDLECAIIKKSSQKNSKFKNIHLGERCFILATGPSVKNQDLRYLQGEYCIGVSYFFLHKDIELIQPRYHIIAPAHPPITFESYQSLFQKMYSKYSNDFDCFLGNNRYQYSGSHFLRNYPEYNNNKVHIIEYSSSQELDEQNYFNDSVWDICASPFIPRTVIYSAIQLAIYMGFKKIYLLGCDHDYLVDIARVTDHHFYEEKQGQKEIEEQVLKSFDTEMWFREYYERWKHYRLIKEYSRSIGCQIYNATQGGMLDVFPRIKFEDLFIYSHSQYD